MWSLNLNVVLNQIKSYSNLVKTLSPLITEKNVLLSTLKTISYMLRAKEA